MPINHIQLLAKSKKLTEEFAKAPQDLQVIIKDLDKRVRKAVVEAKLYDLPEIQKIVNEFAGMINQINSRLQNDTNLMSEDGKRMFEKKQMYQQFLDSFVKTPENLESLSEEVEKIVQANNINV